MMNNIAPITKEEFLSKVKDIFFNIIQDNIKEHLNDDQFNIVMFMIKNGSTPPDKVQQRIEYYLGEKSDAFFEQCQNLTRKIIAAYIDLDIAEKKIQWNITNGEGNTEKLETLLLRVSQIKEMVQQSNNEKVLQAHMSEFVIETQKLFGNQLPEPVAKNTGVTYH